MAVERMSVVSKIKSGYIYETDFSTLSTKWEISDLSRITLNDGLTISSGENPFYMYFNQLTSEKQFVLDIKNIYNPTKAGELGGIIVFADENNFIALEEYYDEEKGIVNTYPWLRLVRDYNVYSGYWSDDGKEWTLVGTHNFGELSPKIGIFLNGKEEDMIIEYVRIFRSPYITIHNPPPRSEIQLVGEDGVLKSMICPVHYPKVAFPVSSYGVPFDGRFRWRSEDGHYVETEFLRNLWGGDEFKFQISLDLYYKVGEEFKRVEANEEEFLGHINTFNPEDLYKRKILMKVKNPHHYQFYNVSIEVGPYKDFKDYSKYVGLSLDEDGEFSQEIDLGIVNPFSEEYFWLELSRATEVDVGINEVYFSLKVNSNVDL